MGDLPFSKCAVIWFSRMPVSIKLAGIFAILADIFRLRVRSAYLPRCSCLFGHRMGRQCGSDCFWIRHFVFRKHDTTPNRDLTCRGMAWARPPVNREVAGAWLSRRKNFFSDVVSATPFIWGPATPFFSSVSSAQPSMVNVVGIWRRVWFSKSAYWGGVRCKLTNPSVPSAADAQRFWRVLGSETLQQAPGQVQAFL